MLSHVDVSADPSAAERARLPARTVSDALDLGFEHQGWVASVFEGGAAAPMICGVYVHRNRRMILEVVSTPFDSSALKTLIDDGTVLMTETMPPEREWRLARRGIFPPKKHLIDLAFVPAGSVAELLAAHEERVRACEARGLRVSTEHDRRTLLAMKQRWREVADPRMKLQTKIALWTGAIAMAAVMIAAIAAARVFAAYGGVLLLFAFAGPPIGFAVFKWMLMVVAPILAKGAPAPPPRPASELLALADRVKSGFLPVASAPSPATGAPPAGPRAEARTPSGFEGLFAKDLVLHAVTAAALPLVALVLFLTASPTIALGALAVFVGVDSTLVIVTKTSALARLRERLLPRLVLAENSVSGSACAPARVMPWVRMLFGVSCAIGAWRATSAPTPALSRSDLVQFTVIVAFFTGMAVMQAKKRHRALAEATVSTTKP